MHDGKIFLAIGLICLLIGTLIGRESMSSEYKRGQIDCLQGQIRYEMHVEQDTMWRTK